MRIGIIHYQESSTNLGKIFLILGTAWQQGIGILRPAPFPSPWHVPSSCLWHKEPWVKHCLSAPVFLPAAQAIFDTYCILFLLHQQCLCKHVSSSRHETHYCCPTCKTNHVQYIQGMGQLFRFLLKLLNMREVVNNVTTLLGDPAAASDIWSVADMAGMMTLSFSSPIPVPLRGLSKLRRQIGCLSWW